MNKKRGVKQVVPQMATCAIKHATTPKTNAIETCRTPNVLDEQKKSCLPAYSIR